MSDDTSAQPAPAQSAETISGDGAPESVAPAADVKAPESDESSAAVTDGAGADKVKSEDQGTVVPYNPPSLASTLPIGLLRANVCWFV
jgi:hypothetical protein